MRSSAVAFIQKLGRRSGPRLSDVVPVTTEEMPMDGETTKRPASMAI